MHYEALSPESHLLISHTKVSGSEVPFVVVWRAVGVVHMTINSVNMIEWRQ